MNIIKNIVCILAILALLISAAVPNVGALVENKSLKDLVKDSDSITTGKVIEKKFYKEEGKIFTDVTISIDMSIKGNSGSQIVVKVPGGAVGEMYAEVSDTPYFETGEDVLLFSKGNAVVGWNQGKYTIKGDKIKETGESLAEFVHKIKKEMSDIPKKGQIGKSIDIISEKLDITSAVQIPADNSKNKIAIVPPISDDLWTTIKYEGFEGAFPNTWARYGSPTWCDNYYRSAVGGWSGWPGCAGTGAVSAGSLYPNNMESQMVYGPFSLVGATDALVTFKHWTDTEYYYDAFQVLASVDGSNWAGTSWTGDWTPWRDETFDLKNVYALGDLREQPNVWIMFRFYSDNTVQYNGTFLDEINIQKDTTPVLIPHITSVIPTSGPAKAAQIGSAVAASDSTQVTITGTNFGSTPGSAKFWRVQNTVYSATILSWTDNQIIARVPGGISSYYKPDGTGNVQVVRSDGTISDNFGLFRVTYSYGGGKWPGGNPIYKVNPNTADTTNELAAVQAAANTWSAAGANFNFIYGGLSTKTSVSGDGENSIIWGSTGGSIATTWTYWGADPNVVLENDLVFEDGYDWGTDGSPTKMDVETIALHEFGHWLYLLDMYGSADSTKVMYGYGDYGNIRRVLNTDDIAGIVYIYGAATNSPPNVPSSLAQFKTDGVTGIAVGGTTTETTVIAKGVVSDPNSDTVQLEVEVKPVGTAFTNYPTCTSGSAVASGSTASATCSGLAIGQYHWQARAKDVHGATGSWLSAGGNPETSPDFIVDTTTQPATVFVLGGDRGVWYNKRTETSWGGWQSLGGFAISNISSVTLGSDTYIFVNGSDRGVWYNKRTGTSSWGGWQSLGGEATSNPDAVVLGSNLYVFVRGVDYSLYYKKLSGTWTPDWTSLEGYVTSNPEAELLNNELYVFVRGGDYGLWYKKLSGSTFTSWTSLGGYVTSDPVAAPNDVFVRGSDMGMWYNRLSSGSFTGWASLGGYATSRSDAISNDVYVRGSDYALWHNKWGGSSWSGWSSLDGYVTSDPETVVSGSTTYVFVRGGDNALWYKTLTGSTWTPWSSLEGYVTSSPSAVPN